MIELISEDSSYKTSMTVIADLPIIKVRPLTPRIKEEFLLGYKAKLKRTPEEEVRHLKTKSKTIKKHLLRELIDDQNVVNSMKHTEALRQREVG